MKNFRDSFFNGFLTFSFILFSSMTLSGQCNMGAGDDATICVDDTHQLEGTSTGGGIDSMVWTSAGDGNFSDPEIDDPIYTPGANDISNGSVVLTYTAFDDEDNECDSDDMTLTIIDPSVTIDITEGGNPGDGEICEGEEVTLTAMPSPGSSGDYTYDWSDDGPDDPDDDDPNISPTTSGTYTVTVTHKEAGCTATAEVEVTVNSNPNVTVNGDEAVCEDGTIVLTGSHTNGMWETSNSNIASIDPTSGSMTTVTGEADGMATITYTAEDGNGCSGSDEHDVQVNGKPTSTGPTDQEECEGDDATFEVTVMDNSQGGAALQLQWQKMESGGGGWNDINGATNSSLTINSVTSNDDGDMFRCRITDPNDGGPNNGDECVVFSAEATLTVNPNPILEYVEDESVCDDDFEHYTLVIRVTNVMMNNLDVAVTDPPAGINIVETPDGQGTKVEIQNIPKDSGTLTVTFTNNDTGCKTTDSYEEVECMCDQPPADPTPTTPTTQTICEDGTVSAFMVSVADNELHRVDWRNDVGTVVANDMLSYTPTDTEPGTYVYSARAHHINQESCESNDVEFTLVINPRPVVDLTSDPMGFTFCEGGTIQITANVTGPSGPYTFQWDPANNNNGTITVSQPGNIAVTVTVNSTGCQNEDDENITERDSIQVTAQIMDVTCNNDNNGSINLTTTGGAGNGNYIWDWFHIPGPMDDESISGLSGGSYSVTVSDNDGVCSTSRNFVVQEPDAISITEDEVVNAGCHEEMFGSITVSVDGGSIPYSFSWTGPNNPVGDEQISNLGAGIYGVTVTDSNNCTNSLNPITVTDHDEFIPNIQALPGTVVCEGMDITLTAQTGVDYEWDLGHMEVDTTVTTTGQYNVTVTQSMTFCEGENFIDITVNPNPTPTLTHTESSGNDQNDFEACSGDFINLLTDSGYTNYNWSEGDEDAEESNTFIPNSANPDGAIFTVTVTDNNQCTGTNDITITIYQSPDIIEISDSGNNTTDDDQTFSLDNIQVGTCDITEYRWTFQGSPNPSDDITLNTDDNVQVNWSDPGNYLYQLSVRDECGCTSSLDQTIQIVGPEDCFIQEFDVPKEACEGTEVEIKFVNKLSDDCTPGNDTNDIDVVDDDSNVIPPSPELYEIVNTQDGLKTFKFFKTGEYNLKYTFDDGCNCDKELQKQITIFPIPSATFVEDTISICGGTSFDIEINRSQDNMTVSLDNPGNSKIVNTNKISIDDILESRTLTMTEIVSNISPNCSSLEFDAVYIDATPPIVGEKLPDFPLCDSLEAFFIVEFDLSGGTGVYEIIGGIHQANAIIVNDTILRVDSLDGNGDNPQVLIQSGDVCPAKLISLPGPAECSCTSKAAEWLTNLQVSQCSDGVIDLNELYNDEDPNQVFEFGSELVFMINDNSSKDMSLDPETFPVFVSDPVFSIDDEFIEVNTDYFVFPAVLPVNATDSVLFSLRCEGNTSISGSVPIEFRPAPTPDIDGPDQVCANQSDVFYSINNLIEDSDIVWNGPSQQVNGEDGENVGVFFNFPDSGNQAMVFLNEEIEYSDELTCFGSDTIFVTIDNDQFAPPKTAILHWPGNIMASVADEEFVCFQWLELIDDVPTPIAGETNKYFFADPDLNLTGPVPEKQFFVDTWFKNGGCTTWENAECVTRNYWNADFPLTSNASKDDINFFKLYPNPNYGEFNVEITGHWAGTYEYLVGDGMGKILQKGAIEKDSYFSNETIDISSLPNGVYMIILYNEIGEKRILKAVKAE